MTDITTIQISKPGLADLNKAKLKHEAKVGKYMSMEDFLLELIK